MNCPVCNRNLVETLSICPACGAMMNDSVREEHTIKKSPIVKSNMINSRPKFTAPESPVLKPSPRPILSAAKPLLENKPVEQKPIVLQKPVVAEHKPIAEHNPIAENKPAFQKPVTAQLNVKATSPTLVEFQHKEKALPDWRLELKNAVRQKLHKEQAEGDEELFPAPRVINRTAGATALKAEYVEEEEEVIAKHENKTVQNALRRIEQSRQKFLAFEETITVAELDEPAPKKDFPYYIAARTNEVTAPKTEMKPPTYTVAKPKLISTIPAESFKRDTNKLPPLPKAAKVSTSFDKKIEPEFIEEILPVEEAKALETVTPETILTPVIDEELIEINENQTDENEDLAPFAMRFNAGIFDLIIGGFASLILLAPFIILGGNWFTSAGLLAFVATCSIVMFIYMTTAVGMFGKTFGMKMFSLEIIDIEENDYPTFHQAAVSAAVYLLSLALGGSGFLTVFFTDEKRAVHDIVSGTLMVKDYQEETA